MAFIEMNMYSNCLHMDTSVNVLLPESKGEREVKTNEEYPVIYVLHGYSDNYSSWMRKSCLEFIARDYDCVVVMPEVNNSFYADKNEAECYYSYLTEELPIKLSNFFHVSTDRNKTFVMGNSMGGYGAFKLAMSMPEQYAAAFSFSGILGLRFDDHYMLMKYFPDFRQNCLQAFESPERLEQSYNSLYFCAERLEEYQGEKPRFFHVCGTKDVAALDMGKEFIVYCKKFDSFHIQYEEVENAGHDWNLWNPYITKAFEFFGIKKRYHIKSEEYR